MVPFRQRLLQFALQNLVVDGKPDPVELVALDIERYLPVMPVQAGAIARITTQQVRSGEVGLDHQFIAGHLFILTFC